MPDTKTRAKKSGPAKRGRPRKTPADEASTRAQIIETAMHAFARNGFDGVTMTEIARQADVSQTLMHYYFDDKFALWDEAVQLAYTDLHAAFDDFSTELADLDCVEQLKLAVRRFVRISARRPEIALLNIQSLAGHGAQLRHVIDEHIAPLQNQMISLIVQAQDQGRMKPGDPAHALQITIGAVVHFLITGAMSQPMHGINPLDEEWIKKHADLVVEILFHGSLTDPD